VAGVRRWTPSLSFPRNQESQDSVTCPFSPPTGVGVSGAGSGPPLSRRAVRGKFWRNRNGPTRYSLQSQIPVPGHVPGIHGHSRGARRRGHRAEPGHGEKSGSSIHNCDRISFPRRALRFPGGDELAGRRHFLTWLFCGSNEREAAGFVRLVPRELSEARPVRRKGQET
jgi:hypothetical protein